VRITALKNNITEMNYVNVVYMDANIATAQWPCPFGVQIELDTNVMSVKA